MMVSEQKHGLNGSGVLSGNPVRSSNGVNHAASALATATSMTTTSAAASSATDGKASSSAISTSSNLMEPAAAMNQSMDMSFATASSMAASADPIAAAAAAAAVGLADPNSTSALGEAMAFAALPFDENLMNLPHGNGGSAANFFIDTAMLAQQIAAVVADEKKLSDNIMDLMPPPMPIVTSGADLATSGMLTSTTASTTTSMSLTTPLAPPPELMMRALSPPMSLLPELSQPHPVPPLSLDGSSTIQTTSMTSVATKAPVKAEPTQPPASAPAPVPVSAPAVAATPLPLPPSILDDRRKPVINNHAALLKKRKSAEAFGDVKSEHSLPTASSLAALSSLNPGSSTTSNNGVMSTAAAVAAAAREKVMKEPQSGDLYECVITKRNGGLGLTLACVDDHVQITGLAPDTPAANSGICVGDTLVAVSGLPVRGLQFSTVIGRLKSTSRSSVVLKLRRNPFRQNAGGSAPYRGIKRPARPASKTSESNSANVLSSKSMALETRLGGAGMNGANGSMLSGAGNGVDDAHHHPHGVHASHLNHLHMKVEPVNSSYFPTDASILTMGPSSALLSSQSVTSLPGSAELQWKVSTEEKDRYFAECRALKHELACAILARRSEKRHAEEYAGQLQEVVDKFQSDMKALLKTPPSSLSGSNGSSNEDLVALRQKLLEVNHALARQQTEILELKERETRHALPESQRVKWQIVMLIKKSMYQLDLKTLAVVSSSASSAGSSASSSPVPTLASSISKTSMTEKEPPVKKQTFEERLDGIRPSVFELLFRQDMKVPAMATAPSIGLDLDAKACTQMLGWNLREVVSQGNVGYVVFVENFVHVKYLRAEEALVISWQFTVQEYNY